MKFIKEHWFGILISTLMSIFVIVFLLVAIAPHTDAKKRGFVPCTEEITSKIALCNKYKAFCLLNTIFKGNLCYTSVITQGIINFATNKQKTPWENYIFIPEDEDALSDIYPNEEEMTKILQEHPELLESFAVIQEKNKELMQKIAEQEKEINDEQTNREPAEMGSF